RPAPGGPPSAAQKPAGGTDFRASRNTLAAIAGLPRFVRAPTAGSHGMAPTSTAGTTSVLMNWELSHRSGKPLTQTRLTNAQQAISTWGAGLSFRFAARQSPHSNKTHVIPRPTANTSKSGGSSIVCAGHHRNTG